MKRIKLLMPLFTFLIILLSCSDDEPTATINELELAAGTYQLVELNINPAQDINNDGNTTTNVLSELTCASGTLTLNSDATWTWSFTEINVTSITGGLFNFSCPPELSSMTGSWQAQNDLLTLFDGANTYTFTKNEDRITNTINDDLPGFQSMVYEK
ncbi:MAG: hypothetical protein WBM77_12030 [Maribacter sp.]